MIGGATRGSGGAALGRHLAADEARPGASRGLLAEDIRAQVAELTRLGEHARTRTPLYHVHADPPADRPWSPDERQEYWRRFEAEFGLQDRPFAATIHGGHGREHEHRVYLRVRPDGTAIRLDHDHARRERLHREFEFDRGEPLVPGAHNKAVLHALDRLGRDDVSAAMREAAFDTMKRPRAPTTPQERAQVDRTSVRKEDVRAATLAAWRSADSGPAFEAALAERGLRLARGEKTIQIVDNQGGTHDLRRSLAQAVKAKGGMPIQTADIAALTAGLALPSVDAAREAIADAVPALQQTPTPAADVAPQAPVGASENTVQTSAPAGAPAAEAPRQESGGRKEKSGSTSHPGRDAGVGADPETDIGDEAIDWSQPGAWDKWVRQQEARARREKAKAVAAARAAAPQDHGGHDAKHAKELAEQLAKRIREFFYRPEAPTSDLDRRARRDSALWDDGRRKDPRHSGDAGQPRYDAYRLRDAQGGEDQRRPDALARSVESAGGGRGEQDRPGRDAPRDDGRSDRQDRAAAGRRRIADRRTERGLAAVIASRGDRLAELTERLRRPPSITQLAHQALDAADRRTHTVLSGEPRPLDAHQLAVDGRTRVHNDASARDRAAEAARERLVAAESRIGFIDRLAHAIGVRTVAVRERAAAAAAADRTEAVRPDRREVDEMLARANRSSCYAVEAHQRERAAFEAHPDVQQVRREAHGNRLLRVAIAGGDQHIVATAAHDLPASRELVLRREAEERLRLEVEARERIRQHQSRERRSGSQPSAPVPGPRRP